MRSSFIYLAIGGGLLAVGIGLFAFAALSIASTVLQHGDFMRGMQILPGSSSTLVAKNVTTGQTLLISISGMPANTPFTAQVESPNGTVSSTYHFNSSPFSTTVRTTTPGDYTLVIKNSGNSSVTTNAAVISVPFGQAGQYNPGNSANFTGGIPPGAMFNGSQVQSFVTYGLTILAGIVLIIAGTVMLIIGTIKVFRERKRPGEAKSQTNP